VQLVSELSKKIIKEVQLVMKEHVIVTDIRGIIIASTEEKRVGFFHEGAWNVMQKKQKLYISKKEAADLKGVKPGINLPISYQGDIIGVIGITGTPEAVEPFADIIRRLTELIIREAYYIEAKEWENKGVEAFFREWIYSQQVDAEFIERGHILGVQVDSSYCCTLFQFDSSLSKNKQQQVQEMIRYWFESHKGEGDYIANWGYDRLLLLKEAVGEKVRQGFKEELKKCQQYIQANNQVIITIGVGKPAEQFNLHASYEEAKKALKVASKRQAVVFYEELLMDMILEDVSEPVKKEFLSRVLSALLKEKELLETLKCYLSNDQSLKKTAVDLHIHINTLHYRLKQMKELTDIDPKSVKGLTLFYLALSLLE